MKIKIKHIVCFIIIDILILAILLIEDYFIGSSGRFRIGYSPSDYDDMLKSIHIFLIESLAITTFSFWLYFKSRKTKK